MSAVIGVVVLLLLTAAAARYSTMMSGLDDYDRRGALVFFIAVGLPMVIVGLALVARYVSSGA